MTESVEEVEGVGECIGAWGKTAKPNDAATTVGFHWSWVYLRQWRREFDEAQI